METDPCTTALGRVLTELDGVHADILELWIHAVPQNQGGILCLALACTGCARAVRDVYPAGWFTSQRGVFSSTERCLWAYSLENRPPWNGVRLCQLLSAAGNLELLCWAMESGLGQLDARCCSEAALTGSVSVLQWLRAHGCQWGSTVCSNAASRNHLELLEWARAEGCRWSYRACCAAAGAGHVEMLTWLLQNGCPCNTTEMFKAAARGGQVGVLEWACETLSLIHI
eukprot:TRINITY_DN51012_c0_g1_i1.p1 TRINITY_DN51012_c0_g1~~TRINITY_DN51012_c0_g1_i1.p1  ORF type:complete len:228 (-),score=13.53 TRINITY_DN51012_c0_g1_i1:164-847(-)